jgi:dynein heavy chain, axonemal
VWKKENFDLTKYKKGTEDRGWILTNTDEKKLLLEDQLANLQTVASSKYAGAFSARIRYWERGLNLISECIEVWLQVQKKWMYLEGIFIGNEDIKQQLKEESKKFEKNNLAFKKIMEHTFKTPNIFAVCVQYEGKLT